MTIKTNRIRPRSDDDTDGFFSFSGVRRLHEQGDASADDFEPCIGLQQWALLPMEDGDGNLVPQIAGIRVMAVDPKLNAVTIITTYAGGIFDGRTRRVMNARDLAAAIAAS